MDKVSKGILYKKLGIYILISLENYIFQDNLLYVRNSMLCFLVLNLSKEFVRKLIIPSAYSHHSLLQCY